MIDGGLAMADEREIFPAFHALPCTARAFLAAIHLEIGQGTSAAISKGRFITRHGLGRGMVRANLKRLEQLGFIVIERGSARPRVANRFQLADSWKELSEPAAKLLVRVKNWRKPRVVRLLQMLARAAGNGNAEARSLLRKHVRELDPYALADVARLRPDLFVRAYPRVKPKHPHRRDFSDDGRRGEA